MPERDWYQNLSDRYAAAVDEQVFNLRYVPDLQLAPSYVVTSPLGVRERVHVITTLEDA